MMYEMPAELFILSPPRVGVGVWVLEARLGIEGGKLSYMFLFIID